MKYVIYRGNKIKYCLIFSSSENSNMHNNSIFLRYANFMKLGKICKINTALNYFKRSIKD